MLECRGSTTSFIVGSVTELGCTFRGSDNSPPEAYHATIRRAGVDIGFPQQVAVAWAVFAPTRGIQRGDLAGCYAGASASATVGVGARRQRADRRIEQHHRVSAAERPGADRTEHRGGHRRHGPSSPLIALQDFWKRRRGNAAALSFRWSNISKHRWSHPSPRGEGPREARGWGEAGDKTAPSPHPAASLATLPSRGGMAPEQAAYLARMRPSTPVRMPPCSRR